MSQQAIKTFGLMHTHKPCDCSGPRGVQQLIDKNEAYLKTSASGGLPVMVGGRALPSIAVMTAEGPLERIYTAQIIRVWPLPSRSGRPLHFWLHDALRLQRLRNARVMTESLFSR